ncbi:MAG: ribonuclease P protein component [Suipraeoptans sp.]
MNFTESLKKNNDFKEVYSSKKSYANKYAVMYVKKNNLNNNRLGISVSKKVGNSVVRHRIKRLIKEAYRLQEDKFKNGYDIVIIARNNIIGREFEEIGKAISHLGRLHKLFIDLE